MVLQCTGKMYYDLAEHRAKSGITDTAIVRVERLYPIPAQELRENSRYPADVIELVWCAGGAGRNQGGLAPDGAPPPPVPDVIGRSCPGLSRCTGEFCAACCSAKVHAATARW